MSNQHEDFYHIYVNGICVEACVLEEELDTHLHHLKGFYELKRFIIIKHYG